MLPASNENISDFPSPLPEADHFIKIEDGTYTADCVGSLAFHYLGTAPRLALCFRILEDVGPERHIWAYYKVLALSRKGLPIDKAARVRNPQFKIGWRSRLARDLGTLFAEYSPRNLPTSVPSIIHPVRIRTTTVHADRDGVERPEAFQGSKVDAIVGWAE